MVYIKNKVLGAAVTLVVILFLSGCSYGTYYATGSYANQDNSKDDSCKVK